MNFKSKILRNGALLGVYLALSSVAYGQKIDLDFSNYAEATDGSHGYLGPSYSGSTLSFTNVATYNGVSVDALVTVTPYGDGIALNGTFPNYRQVTGSNPNGDIGFLFDATQNGLGGVEYEISFMESGTNFQTAITLPEIDLMVYDVDGESMQSESVIASKADGLHSYQTGTGAASLTAEQLNENEWQFVGPGLNFDEADTSGAAILTFRDTDSVKLRFESETEDIESTGPNGVFSAIDGDAQLPEGSFGPAIDLPEPSSTLAMALLVVATLTKRRRDPSRMDDMVAA